MKIQQDDKAKVELVVDFIGVWCNGSLILSKRIGVGSIPTAPANLLHIYKRMKINRIQLRKLIRECINEMFDTDEDERMDNERAHLVKSFDHFTGGYLDAALFTSTDNRTASGGEPLSKNYSWEDFHIDTLKRMQKDCEDFQKRAKNALETLELESREGGMMFWYSRNGHGTGFWDVKDWRNEYAEAWGEMLHKLAKAYGPYDLYIADSGRWDGLIFGYPA